MPLLSIPDVAEQLGVSDRMVRNLVFKRELPHVKVGRLVRFKQADIDAFIERQTVAISVPPADVPRRRRRIVQPYEAASKVRKLPRPS